MLSWDGEEIAQQMAIVRFLARKLGLAGKTDLEFAYADMMRNRGGIWFNGSSLSFGDLAMMVELTFLTHSEESAFTGMNNAERRAAVLESRPLLRGNMQRVMEVEEIAKYLRVRPAFNGR